MALDKLIHKAVNYDGESVILDKKTDLHGTYYSPKKGPANDVGIIICHGLTLFRKLFEPMAKVIRDKGFDVLTFTFRGHGWRRFGKHRQSRKLTLERALEDVKHTIKFMQKHDQYPELRTHKKLILVGHSLGALMSLRAAICTETKADIVALALIGCPTRLADYKTRTTILFAAAKFLANVDVSEVMSQVEDFDTMKDLKHVNVPTLMIYGEFDEILLYFRKKPKELKKELENSNSFVKFKSIKGMFHNPINLLHGVVNTSAEKCYKIIADWIEKYT